MRFLTILIALLFLCKPIAQCQFTDIVLGDHIIQLPKTLAAHQILKKYSTFQGKTSKLRAQQLCAEPINLWLVSIDYKTINQEKFIAALREDKEILHVQRNRLIQKRNTPNDEFFPLQWQLSNTGQNGGQLGADIKILNAWDIATGGLTALGDTIVVCVIDDGVDQSHPDLDGNLWINYNEIPNNGIDDDNNGYIDDYYGWNVLSMNDDVFSDGVHGTPIFGIIGAKGNNEIGVSGINWNIKMMNVDYGATTEANALASYAYPYIFRKRYNESNGTEGAFVVATNASWGVNFGKPEEAPIWCAFYDSLGSVGILNAGATANRNVDVDIEGDLPTACESDFLISVTNMDRNNNKVTAAGYGRRSIDLGAYGRDAYNIRKGGAYGGFGGTSSATPHVAGVIGLLYSGPCEKIASLSKSDPAMAALVIKDLILNSVTPNDALARRTTTGGVLNAGLAMERSQKLCSDCHDVLIPIIRHLENNDIEISFFSFGDSIFLNLEINSFDIENSSVIQYTGSSLDRFVFTPDDFCSFYEIQIEKSCSPDGDFNQSLYTRFIKSPGCCSLPIQISHQIKESDIFINLVGASNTDYFLLELKQVTDSSWDSVYFFGNTHLLDLAECQIREYRITKVCEEVSAQSVTSSIQLLNSPCGKCSAEGFCHVTNLNNAFEWLEEFGIGTFKNLSGRDATGYGNYKGDPMPNLVAGSFYPVYFIPGFNQTLYSEVYSIYLDINQDGEFSESELIYVSGIPTSEPVSGFLQIPSQSLEGICRMRVIMSFEKASGPCTNADFRFGEVEDYCVFINSADSDCNIQYALDSLTVGLFNVVFEVSNTENQNYVIRYRQVGELLWNELYSNSREIEIEELERCVNYEFIASAICGNNEGPPSQAINIKTKCEVSTEDFDHEQEYIKIYPSPFLSHPRIELKTNHQGKYNVSIISLKGETMVSYSIDITEAINIRELTEFNELPSGAYLIRINNGLKSFVGKAVKI
jgi:serine protease